MEDHPGSCGALNGFPPAVREATPADAAFLQSLSREAFARFGEYDRYLEDLLRGGALARVADLVGSPVGFSVLLRVEGAPEGFDLIALAVTAPERRRGIGRALLHDAHRCILAAIPRAGRLRVGLHVAETNVPARRLFESAGYRLAGRDDDYYPNGQRALSMERWLVRGFPVE